MTDEPQSGPLGRLAVGIDVGTTSLKAVMVDEQGNVVARNRLACALQAGPRTFEHDAAQAWWHLPRQALSGLVGGYGAQVAAVAVCAPMPSLCAVVDDGRPVGPGLLYGDLRGQRPAVPGPAGGADPTASDEVLQMASWAAGKYPGARGYWPAQAVVNASLGGEGVLDMASAFAAGSLYEGTGWDASACRSIGITPAQLPKVAVFGEPIGRLRSEVASGLGLGRTELVAGSVDGLCEQLVSGAVEEGDLLVTLGSTMVVWLCVPGWPEAAPGLWKVPHLAPGKAMLGGASNAGGIWLDWVDRLVRQPPGGPAGELVPSHVPLWWPWSRGERVPLHDRELRVGLGGADISHGPAALRRAALEASAFVVRHIGDLASQSGTPVKRVMVTGGGVARPDWAQVLADVLSLPVLAMQIPESAALGAAFLAFAGTRPGTPLDEARHWARWGQPVQPDAQWSGAADERYHRWLAGPQP